MEHLREDGKTLARLARTAALPTAALAPCFCTPTLIWNRRFYAAARCCTRRHASRRDPRHAAESTLTFFRVDAIFFCKCILAEPPGNARANGLGEGRLRARAARLEMPPDRLLFESTHSNQAVTSQ